MIDDEPRHRRRPRGRHGPPRRRPTSASGRPRSTTPSGWPASRSFVNTDEPDPTITHVRVRGQRQPAVSHAMTSRRPTPTLDRRCARLDRLTPDRGVAALVDGAPGRRVPAARRRAARDRQLDPFSGASVLSRGIVGDVDGVPDGGLADLQAALRPRAPGGASTTPTRRSPSTTSAIVDGTRRGARRRDAAPT